MDATTATTTRFWLRRFVRSRRALPVHRPVRPNLETIPIEDLSQFIRDLREELTSARVHRDLGATHPSVTSRIGRLVRDIWAAEAVLLRRTDDVTAVAAATTALTGRSL
jgi:hypothetical protein